MSTADQLIAGAKAALAQLEDPALDALPKDAVIRFGTSVNETAVALSQIAIAERLGELVAEVRTSNVINALHSGITVPNEALSATTAHVREYLSNATQPENGA